MAKVVKISKYTKMLNRFLKDDWDSLYHALKPYKHHLLTPANRYAYKYGALYQIGKAYKRTGKTKQATLLLQKKYQKRLMGIIEQDNFNMKGLYKKGALKRAKILKDDFNEGRRSAYYKILGAKDNRPDWAKFLRKKYGTSKSI